MDEEDKAVECMWGTVSFVIFRVYGPDSTPENSFLRLEVMVADCPGKWRETGVLWREKRKAPWRGIAVDGKVPE